MDRIDEQVKSAADRLNAGDVAAAERIGRELLATAPRSINALRLMGAITRKQGQLEQSLDYFRQALRHNDRKGLLHFELGTAYTELQRSEEAYECYFKAVQLDPTLQPAFVNLSAIMEQHERLDEAIEWAEKAIALKPDCGLAHYNLANAQRELGQLPAAIESYSNALRFKPDHAKTLWNLGICHLLAGNFREGWPLFEQRQDAQEVFFDRYPQPRWDGSSLAGKTIVVHAEQGIGDEILFASCFPDLMPLAKRCIFVCDPRLERLLARSFPRAGVYSHLRRKDWSPPALPEPFDVQIPAGSLPLHFRLSPESFPRRERFLEVDPRLLTMWQSRLAAIGPGLKIGISWRAGGKPLESRKRTIPLDHWGEIFAVPGTRFVNLQYGDASADIAAAKSLFGVEIHDWEEGDPLIDVDSFAAKIAALDLVISVGNATVHIAGAVGTPTWTLLPMVPSWRWMISGEESPWYARVRLFRQSSPGDWQSVLERITRMLQQRAGAMVAASDDSKRPDSKTNSGQSSRRPANRRWFGAADLAGHKTDQLVGQALEDARRAEESGDLAQAERKYREVVQLAPRHFGALNGLGVVARKTGRTELAIRSFRRSLAMIEALPIQQFNLADALADAGRFDEALEHYRRGLKLEPTNAAAHVQAGRMLQRLNRHSEAIDHFQKALTLDPRREAALAELGNSLTACCRIDESIDHLERAVQLRPESAMLLASLGATYLEDQRFDEAADRLRQATAIAPDLATAHLSLGQALQSLDRFEEAAACFERVIELDENCFAAITRMAMLRRDRHDIEGAATLFRRALAIRPAEPQVLNALGVVLRQLGASDDALDCFDDAIHFAPDFAEAHVNRAFALLRAGRLAEGWAEHEWRHKCHNAGRARNAFPLPVWDGSSLAEKTILVFGEQEPAEELMFASCYADLVERAAHCVIACDPRLESLLRRSLPKARVCPMIRGREAQWRIPEGLKIDVQIPADSLPRLLRPTLESFPKQRSYLIADSAATLLRRRELAKFGNGLKVGIAAGRTAGNSRTPERDATLNLPEALANVTGAKLLSVTGDVSTSDELAAEIAALDLVISEGGLVAHLAGALGVPSWVVLPIDAEWYWFDDDTSIWYPSVRLFRQQRPNDWTAPIARLRTELLNLIARDADRNGMRPISGPHWAFGPLVPQAPNQV